jgi:hypothetical protein
MNSRRLLVAALFALALLGLVALAPAGAQADRPPAFEAELAGPDVDIERAPGHYIVIQRSTGHYLDPGAETEATGTAHLMFLAPGVQYRVMVENLTGAQEVSLFLVAEREGEVFTDRVATLWSGRPGPSAVSGRLAGGWLTEGDLVGPLAARGLSGLLRAAEAGNIYVVVHTEAWPKGEIGGPLIPVTFR